MPRPHPPTRALRLLSISVSLAAFVSLESAPVRADGPTSAEVRQSIVSAISFLKRAQAADGAWPYTDDRFTVGHTALATLALVNAGVPAGDPDVAGALNYLSNSKDLYTYNMALKLAALAQADPQRYRAPLGITTTKLCQLQLSNGMWPYGGREAAGSMRGDNSNTQLALFGLHEAARAGIRINAAVWRSAAQHWNGSQSADGSWGYPGRTPRGHGSMTAAGVASLIICGDSVNRSLEHGYNERGAAARCGEYATNPHVAAGLAWLGEHFDVRRNPRHSAWHFYWLYAVERAGMLSGLKYFGRHDWYREGAEFLVDSQRANGSWNGLVTDTAFGLLFLAKGRRPVLVNKLMWSHQQKDWNLDRHDCENLVAFTGDHLGEPVTWQTIPLDAPLEEWLEAPLLYFQGHEFPLFSEDDVEKLRRFVEAGGTIFADSCCSREPFARGFERFIHDAFPEYATRELSAEHPVWTSVFPLKPERFRLIGLDAGCRTSVIFAPTDLSCLWEQANTGKLAQEALQLGVNIAAYATGHEPLRDKLDVVELPAERRRGATAADAPGGLQMVQLVHQGDWRPDANVLPKLAELLHAQAGVDVDTRSRTMKIDDPALLEHPIAYLTGHFSFRLTPAEIAALRQYLTRGGFLFAEACCGRKAFDESFRTLAAELFPGNALALVGPDHPVFKAGHDISQVEFRPAVKAESPQQQSPQLEAVTIDGRAVIVYSPYGLGCGVEDHNCYNCRGLAPEDARRTAANIVLYALTH